MGEGWRGSTDNSDGRAGLDVRVWSCSYLMYQRNLFQSLSRRRMGQMKEETKMYTQTRAPSSLLSPSLLTLVSPSSPSTPAIFDQDRFPTSSRATPVSRAYSLPDIVKRKEEWQRRVSGEPGFFDSSV